VIRLKAILLLIELKFPVENCRTQISAVRDRLPPGSNPVLHAEKSIGFLIPPGLILEELRAKVRPALAEYAFENWRLIGLSGETLCKNGSMDPIEDWMNDYRVSVPRRQRLQSQNVPLTERRERWRKNSV
jgi:hypothetical protein